MTLDELVEVEWFDAADHVDENINDVFAKPTKDYLVRRTSYGRLLKQDMYGVVIATDIIDDSECEITAIPRPWLSPNTEKKLYQTKIEEECNYK